MLVNSEDINKFTREEFLKHILELSLKSIAELRDIPELEEPTDEQNQFIKGKVFHK